MAITLLDEAAHDALDHTGLTGVGGSAAFVGARVTNSAAQTISDSTTTPLTFNTEAYDTDAIHDTGSNTSRLTVPTGKGGKWRFAATTMFAADADGNRQIALRVDGTTIVPGSAVRNVLGLESIATSATLNLTAGQYVEVVVWHSAGNNLDVGAVSATGLGNAESAFECQYLGA